ncbi:MAG: UMP kinase [Candidatus Magasanikbacteria bacterium]
MKQMKVLSVGGSIIIPRTGIDPVFLKKFRAMILEQVKKGDRFVLIIGGGATARNYQDGLRNTVKVENEELDWLGIQATVLNAFFVKQLFGDLAYKEVLSNPNTKIKTQKPIIIASGWKPGCSTDYDAVLFAKNFGAGEVLNLSNIEYVYDIDPKVFPEAKKIEEITWKEFRKNIVGDVWSPGSNYPFDPIASKKAEQLKLRVGILQGTNLKEVKNALGGKKFKGTIIHP